MKPYAGYKEFMTDAPLKERVIAFLEKLIIEGDLKPRERLIENEISLAFDVSRPPIREALRALESEGLVVSLPNRGVTVAEITEKDVQNVYLIRASLESLAVKLATDNLTSEKHDFLESIYLLMVQKAKEGDLSSYFQMNREFHETVLQAADNEQLTRILRNLGKQTMPFRFFVISTPGMLQKSLENHRNLLDALRARDGEQAGRLRYEQIQNGGQILRTRIHGFDLASL
jgi:DNA-binding GntR family transcriptional regulator